MNVYIIVFIFLSLLSIYETAQYKNGSSVLKRTYIFACVAISPLILFRDISVGYDTAVYCNRFLFFGKANWTMCFTTGWEPGLPIVMKLIYIFSQDTRAYIIIVGLISLIPAYVYIYKYTDLPIFSLLLLYVFCWNKAEFLNRQWIAMLITMASYKYIVERRMVPYIMLILCATLFHRSALVFAIIYVLYNRRIKTSFVLFSIPLLLIFYFGGGQIRGFFERFARGGYLDTENTGGLPMLVFLIICFVVSNSYIAFENKDYDKLFVRMLWIAAITQPLVFSFHSWARANSFFTVGLIFCLPAAIRDILYNNVEKNKTLAFPLMLVFCCLLFYFFAKDGIKTFIPMQF